MKGRETHFSSGELVNKLSQKGCHTRLFNSRFKSRFELNTIGPIDDYKKSNNSQ